MESAPRNNEAQGCTPLQAFRYERKFRVEEISLGQIKSLIRLHPKLFYQPHPPRYVNNIYLDTVDLENYYDSVHGSYRRRKMRVRWYGELCGMISRPILEIKIKDGLVGNKLAFPLHAFQLSNRFCDRYFQQILNSCGLPGGLRSELRSMNVVLLNRYYRHYYTSRDGSFRVTADTELSFYRVNGAVGNQLIHKQFNFLERVVELKYAIGEESQADRVAGFFPFRVTRSSKYVQGIEKVYF